MKKGTKKPVFYTPENISGPCFSGKNITQAELKQVNQSINAYKAKNTPKKSLLQRIFS